MQCYVLNYLKEPTLLQSMVFLDVIQYDIWTFIYNQYAKKKRDKNVNSSAIGGMSNDNAATR